MVKNNSRLYFYISYSLLVLSFIIIWILAESKKCGGPYIDGDELGVMAGFCNISPILFSIITRAILLFLIVIEGIQIFFLKKQEHSFLLKINLIMVAQALLIELYFNVVSALNKAAFNAAFNL